ncbi:metalloregulator ArsR/SmtB family transcription factor, partial [Butyrivibrio sp. WCD2001]|uniref:ArsR/SmtB family transcription factor n=1 Tax=Butyrivibrio sp. WCD2001 TaxID=1280681 RepID=UPI002E8E6060
MCYCQHIDKHLYKEKIMAKLDEVLICKALGDPNRMEIVKMLSDQEKCGCKLLEKFDITQPTLSHHMKILVDSGL